MLDTTRRGFLGLLMNLPLVGAIFACVPRKRTAEDERLQLLTDEALRKAQSEVRAIRWIPVTERLPQVTPVRTVLTVWGEDSAAFVVQIPIPKDGNFHSGITHWAELPAPPSTEKV